VLDKLTGGENSGKFEGGGSNMEAKGFEGRKETAGYAARVSGCVAAFPVNQPICHLQNPTSALVLTP